ncbi:MAG: bifunctional 4-hydroxy-2-oxoglutarate aldolase/2-dehydro-3-deoxy-phosphogluconate aldolase [Phycisphaerae bacterium]|nr:bifunctional 4-hydroxy-2-oxoglutarate aldolase/2-dehydro-3-deoxy-phosphogluconate aldolase [Phycisphaerae bacterium]
MSTEIYEKLSHFGVIPVIAIDSVKSALPLADALIAGGLPVAEITFRTEAAAEVISLLAKERPELLLGAGTVLTPEHMQKAKDCGATFAVSPGLNPETIKKAKEINLPFMPGISSPTDIETALSLGCKALKFFPAEASGGVKYLNAITAPYRHTGVTFIPTGGINVNNLTEYLALDTVIACGGTWIAKKEDMANDHWEKIQARCSYVMKIVKESFKPKIDV